MAVIVSVMLGGSMLGALWIYALGDSNWPQGMDSVFSVLFILLFFAIWIALVVGAYKVGKAHETQTAVSSRRVISVAAGATVGLLLLMALHQWQVGSWGPKSDSGACADYCLDNGYAASMISARNTENASCECLDPQGKTMAKILLNVLPAR